MDDALPAGYQREADGRIRPPQLFADATLDREFWVDGMVKQPCLDEEELAELAVRFGALRPADGFDPTRLAEARCSYHCTFLDEDRSYRRRADELVREVFEARLRTLLPTYRILSSNIYVKPPGHGRFEIHQNWPTIRALDAPTLTVWVPLQDTTFENGTIRIVRGSHHVFPDVAAASSDRFFDDFEDQLIESYLEPVPVRAGEALCFDDSLLHWSGTNRSSQPRVTFQIEMIPEDVPAVLWIRPADDPDHFELWEVDKEYWIEYPFESVLGRPEGLPFAGKVPNPNQRLTFEEFASIMSRHVEVRRSKYVLD